MVTAKQMATTTQRSLVNQVKGGEKNMIQRTATRSCRSLRTPGHRRKCLVSSSTSSGMADSVVVLVSSLNEYLGLLFSILVVYLRPPGPLLTVVVVMVEPAELGRIFPILHFGLVLFAARVRGQVCCCKQSDLLVSGDRRPSRSR